MILASHASSAFNQRLAEGLSRLARDVESGLEDHLIALVLGGGYGRGEGGVVRYGGREVPYNDLDLFLIVTSRNVPRPVLSEVSRRYGNELGVDVDFSRPLTLTDIRHWPPHLRWYDLLHGHIVLSGPDDVLEANAPATLRLPLDTLEATRLLLNRGAGLLWAERVVRGLETAPDADFVRRNYYKCVLGMGDAALIAHRRFTTQYAGRDQRLEELAQQKQEVRALGLTALYAEALAFKLRPDAVRQRRVERALLLEMARRWGETLLYVERRRTGRFFRSVDDYVAWRGRRETDTLGVRRWPRHLLANLRSRTVSVASPREPLLRTLPLLLGLTHRSAGDWPRRSATFLRAWSHCN